MVLGAIAGVNFATAYADVAISTMNPLVTLHVHRNDGDAYVAGLVFENSDRLATMDAGGVALAAIQALSTRNSQLESKISIIRAELEQMKHLQHELAEMRVMIGQLRPQMIQNQGSAGQLSPCSITRSP